MYIGRILKSIISYKIINKMKQLFFFLIFTTSMFCQKRSELFNSIKLGESREITIGLPASYTKNINKKYPVLILLDGDYLFDPFYGALSYGEYWDDIPETIVIGINQNKKNQRLDDCEFDPEFGVPKGKGADFFEFIGSELLPYIDKKYRTAQFRIIAGHDTTAGFLNFFLYKDQPVFNAYISLSPDLATEMENILPKRLSEINQPVFYYQSTAEGDLDNIDNPVQELTDKLKAIENPNLIYKFDDFKSASHYSMVLYSIPSALYQIFELFKPISIIEYNEKIAILQENQAEYLDKKYTQIDKIYGYKTQLRLTDVKAIETSILKNKNYGELEKLAVISNKYYPKDMLGEYFLAEMFEKYGEFAKAGKHYQIAYTMNEIGLYTKDAMMIKVDEMKAKLPKKSGRKEVNLVTETPLEQTNSDVKIETPKEDIKPK